MTFQADVVEREMGRMNQVMIETIVIVMIVVVLFLGWRAGVVVGGIVPLTILATLLVMRLLGIELHIVSMAAIIIALGLLVDNGIVIAEDVERRLAAGEERRHACIEAGRTLAIPLLTSSLVIIFAFSPFFFGDTATNEYLRPLVVVLTLSLLGSWLLCLTVTPLLCYFFLKSGHHGGGDAHGHDADATVKQSRFYGAYARLIRRVLDHKGRFLVVMTALLIGALAILATRPAGFLPASDRPQFQVELELQPGSDARLTRDVVRDLSRWLDDRKRNPEVTTSIDYVADGGPRVVPGAQSAAACVAYRLRHGQRREAAGSRRRDRPNPGVDDATPSRGANRCETLSRSAHDAGTVAYRVSGPDEAVLREIGRKIQAALHTQPGIVQIHDDWGRACRVSTSRSTRTRHGVWASAARTSPRRWPRAIPASTCRCCATAIRWCRWSCAVRKPSARGRKISPIR